MKNSTNNIVDFEAQIRAGRIQPGMSFAQRVWAITSRIPGGKVATYGDLAKKLSSSGRAVGQALHRNPFAPGVPCHRVVGSDGSLTGFAQGLPAKRRLLTEEGITFKGDRVDLQRHRKMLAGSV
jgi:methylated-DNA-[protein]-cysteine S-methyltransferase